MKTCKSLPNWFGFSWSNIWCVNNHQRITIIVNGVNIQIRNLLELHSLEQDLIKTTDCQLSFTFSRILCYATYLFTKMIVAMAMDDQYTDLVKVSTIVSDILQSLVTVDTKRNYTTKYIIILTHACSI